MAPQRRRRFLQLTAAAASAAISGCSSLAGSVDPTDSTPAGQPTQTRAGGQQEQSSDAADDTAQSPSERIEELKQRIDSLESKLETRNDTISTLEQRVSKQEAEIEDLENDLADRNTTIEDLQTTLDRKEARVSELERQATTQYSAEVREKVAAVGTRIQKAVVALQFEVGEGAQTGGTGWFIDEQHIITNAHVIEPVVSGDTTSETLYTYDGAEGSISVVGVPDSHHPTDIALLRTDVPAPEVPTLNTSPGLTPGQPLFQVGHPNMIGYWVIGLGEFKSHASFRNDFYTEMPSTNGNSGSPVVNLQGEVVGLTWGASQEADEGKPTPFDGGVREEYPYQTAAKTAHETSQTVHEFYQEWV